MYSGNKTGNGMLDIGKKNWGAVKNNIYNH